MEQNVTAILKTLYYTHLLFTTLPLVFFLLFKQNSKQGTLKVILVYILYCIANEGMSFYLQSIEWPNIIYLFLLFTIVEYSFFCLFIYFALPKNIIRKLVPLIWAAFLAFAIINKFFYSRGQEWDSFTSGIESIIIILLCIYYLFTQLMHSTNLLIYSTFNFWVVITFLIYFAGTFFLYIMTESMRESESFQQQYFIINISFNILKNLLLCVAMTMKLNSAVTKSQPSAIPNLDDDIFTYKKNN